MSPSEAEIIAHRGFSSAAPENTLASLSAALDAGADAVEFDLHTAACGTPVLFHDTMLSRTTNGVGPLRRRTLAQLKGLDAGGWFGADFKGETIPSFAEALEVCRDRAGCVYPEVKGFRELEDLDRMVEIVRKAGMLDDTVFIAMNWTLLDRMRSCLTDLRIGYIVDETTQVAEAFERAAGDERAILDFKADLLLADPSLAVRAGDQGIGLAAWTVDDPADAARLADMGVEGITTNEVARMLDWKRGQSGTP